MMPYRDKKNKVWTSYFTARPDLKFFVKNSGRYLQIWRNWFNT